MSINSLLASDLATAYSLYTTNGSSGSKSSALSSNSALLTAFDQALSTTTGSAALSSKGSTAGSPVAQDLQSFVQDLFSVLHQTSSAHTKSSVSIGRPVTTPTTVKNATRSAPAPKATNTITPRINTAATATVASADASESKTTNATTATSPTAVSTATNIASTRSSKAAQYQQSGTQNIIAALKTLIQDVSSGETLGSSAAASLASSSLSAGTLNNLQSAFSKLAGDFDDTTSSTSSKPITATASTASAKADAAAHAKAASSSEKSAASSKAGAASSSSAQSGTAAFKAFLTTFLHDLQSGGATSGKLVNTKA